MNGAQPFQTLHEFGSGSTHCAVLELDEFTPGYATDSDLLRFSMSLDGPTRIYPRHGAPYTTTDFTVAAIPPGCSWKGSWRGRQTCMLLEIGSPVLRELTRAEIVFPNNRELLMVQDDHLRYGIMALHHDLLAPSPAASLFVGHIARGLVSHYLKAYCADQAPAPRQQKLAPADLRRVLERIEACLDTKPELEDLAAPLGLSVAAFCRRFRNSTGLPPYQYLLHARVERAKQVLQRRQGQSLSELALMLGFYDQSQFTNTFRRMVGVSPRDYVRALRPGKAGA